ncbi:MAG TPA: hypothetical protein VIB11_12550 [Pedococcus sp.]|jgi:hypothetical protein
MKVLTTMFESTLEASTPPVWAADLPEPQPLSAGPRIQTIWGWGGP